MKPVLGIDFGTTNTAAGWVDADGELHLVPVRDDEFTLPSVVSFHESGVLTGQSAKDLVVEAPTNTVLGVKRFLGRMFLSDFVGRNRGRFLFNLVEGDEGLTAVEINGKAVGAEEIAFHILARIVELANIAAGFAFEECVVAVPAHYTFRQRQVIRRVAERLLSVKAMVNEPTAASLYFAHHLGEVPKEDGPILVYDLGGGTFDATLLQLRKGLVEVLATGGDAFLGGTDFDARVVEHLASAFQDKEGVDLRTDAVVMQRLAFAAERAKIALSEHKRARIRVPCVVVRGDAFVDLDLTLERKELERIVAPLVERTLGLSEQIVERAGHTPKSVSRLVLVGGQTRMPALRERLSQVFEIPGLDGFAPETAVAAGAAVLGRGVHTLVDVLSVPVGVMLPGSGPREAVPRNIALPCVRRVPIEPRPPPGQMLAMIFFEAVDLTSIDRDVLGTVRVPAEWLAENEGDLALQVRMSASFELGLYLHAANGGRLQLDVGAKPAPAKAAPTTPEPMALPERLDTVARNAQRIDVGIDVLVRGPAGPMTYRSVNVSEGGVFLETRTPLPKGARVEVEFRTREGPLRILGEIARIVEVGLGKHPGMAVQYALKDEDARAQLDRFLGALRDQVEAEANRDPEPKKPTTRSGLAVQELKRFLKGVADNEIYDALAIDPLAPSQDVRARLDEIKTNLTLLHENAPPPIRPRVETALQILDRASGMLLDPWRRLHYDFKGGRVFAEKRIAQALASGVDITLLREAWRRAHPSKADAAAMHLAHARKAATAGDAERMKSEARSALELDPFDMALRRRVETW